MLRHHPRTVFCCDKAYVVTCRLLGATCANQSWTPGGWSVQERMIGEVEEMTKVCSVH